MKLSSGALAALEAYLAAAPDDVVRATTVLSAAVVLTDDVAASLINRFVPSQYSTDEIVETVRACDFVVERNSEWHIDPAARQALLYNLYRDRELAIEAHALLLELAKQADPREAGSTIPIYLTQSVGRAYHSAPLEPDDGLAIYRAGFTGAATGEQWLLGVLAEEQQDNRILPVDAIDPPYFRGLSEYQEGNWGKAETYFRRVIASNEYRLEVAIALHLLAQIVQRRGDRADAEGLLRRSLFIGEELGSVRHQAHVLHSLGNVVEDQREAVRLYRRSLALLEQIGDEYGQAKVLNSLGNALANRKEAKDHLQRSLALKEAKDHLQRSLALGEKLGHLYHQAQVLHSLGNLEVDPARAENLLRRSLVLEENLRDVDGQGQVLNSLGNLARRNQKWDIARAYHQRALRITRNPISVVVAHLGLSRIEEKSGILDAAIAHMEKVIAVQESTGRMDLVARHQRRLSNLRNRRL